MSDRPTAELCKALVRSGRCVVVPIKGPARLEPSRCMRQWWRGNVYQQQVRAWADEQ